jgi:DNA-binding IclR family transcriptional regulator
MSTGNQNTVIVPEEISPKGRLSSVSAAIRPLKTCSEEESEIGISTLVRKLWLTKSTVHRLATTADGQLEQNPENGRYWPRIELFTMGALVRRRLDLSKQALLFLHELRERTGEAVYRSILDRINIACLYFLESDRANRMRSYMGCQKPGFLYAGRHGVSRTQRAGYRLLV